MSTFDLGNRSGVVEIPPWFDPWFFWLLKKFILAIFNFLTNFWPSKSSIFLVYSHSRGVSHHFQPPLSSLPIGISDMSLRPTYNPPWTPLIRVGSAHIRASVTEEGFSLTSIFISPGLGFSLKETKAGWDRNTGQWEPFLSNRSSDVSRANAD